MTDQKNSQAPSSQNYVAGESTRTQLLAGAGFALIYALMQYYEGLSALAVLALLPCILRRLDERQRNIGKAPLALAALLLTQKLLAVFAPFGSAGIIRAPGISPGPLAAPWLPLFLAAALFYMPDGFSHSRKVFTGLGMLVLCSGLLPEAGFGLVFFAIQYVLFFCVAFGLSMDFFDFSQVKRASGRA